MFQHMKITCLSAVIRWNYWCWTHHLSDDNLLVLYKSLYQRGFFFKQIPLTILCVICINYSNSRILLYQKENMYKETKKCVYFYSRKKNQFTHKVQKASAACVRSLCPWPWKRNPRLQRKWLISFEMANTQEVEMHCWKTVLLLT